MKIEYSLCKVELYAKATICRHCSRLGHIGYRKGELVCTNSRCCTTCGGDHEQTRCPSEEERTKFDCANCKYHKHPETNHKATDPKCPSLKKHLDASIKRQDVGRLFYQKKAGGP